MIKSNILRTKILKISIIVALLLQVAFIILKLTKVISWGWLWVFAFSWIPGIVGIIGLIIMLVSFRKALYLIPFALTVLGASCYSETHPSNMGTAVFDGQTVLIFAPVMEQMQIQEGDTLTLAQWEEVVSASVQWSNDQKNN